jgi:hypothetical protein
MLMLKEHLETMILVVNFFLFTIFDNDGLYISSSLLISFSLDFLSQLMLLRLVKGELILGMFLG